MIAAFVAEKMGRYLAGGMDAETAGDFTRGELSAIYEGKHYSREESGAMRQTPPLESLDPVTALAKCDAVINTLLKTAEEAPTKAHEMESGANKGNGLDGLKNYVRGKTA